MKTQQGFSLIELLIVVTGQHAFCSSQDGVIHYNESGIACNAAPGGDPSCNKFLYQRAWF